MRKILAAAKRASGMSGLRWEVACKWDKSLPNYPFRPENDDAWGGDMEALSSFPEFLKPGLYLECWLYERHEDGELVDNVYIWLDSPTSARVKVCGGQVKTVTLTPPTKAR